jgi:hypothetical protein
VSLLDYPRCPRCQGELAIERLYSQGRTWRGVVLIGDGSEWGGVLTAGNTGIVCPTCGMRLLVLQSRAVWGGLFLLLAGAFVPTVLVGYLARPVHIDLKSPWTIALVVVVVALGSFWISFLNRFAQRFVQVRPLESGEHAAFPLSEHDRRNN